jgi:hypothetical protein
VFCFQSYSHPLSTLVLSDKWLANTTV